MSWQNKWFKLGVRKIALWSIYGAIFIWITILVNYGFWWSFERQMISPLEMPWILPRIFLSTLAFWIPWAFLYKIYFYRGLYNILPRGDFKWAKRLTWLFLMGCMYISVKIVVDFLNLLLSFLFNLLNFAIFLAPWLVFSFIITYSLYFIYLKLKAKESNVIQNR